MTCARVGHVHKKSRPHVTFSERRTNLFLFPMGGYLTPTGSPVVGCQIKKAPMPTPTSSNSKNNSPFERAHTYVFFERNVLPAATKNSTLCVGIVGARNAVPASLAAEEGKHNTLPLTVIPNGAGRFFSSRFAPGKRVACGCEESLFAQSETACI